MLLIPILSFQLKHALACNLSVYVCFVLLVRLHFAPNIIPSDRCFDKSPTKRVNPNITSVRFEKSFCF